MGSWPRETVDTVVQHMTNGHNQPLEIGMQHVHDRSLWKSAETRPEEHPKKNPKSYGGKFIKCNKIVSVQSENMMQ